MTAKWINPPIVPWKCNIRFYPGFAGILTEVPLRFIDGVFRHLALECPILMFVIPVLSVSQKSRERHRRQKNDCR